MGRIDKCEICGQIKEIHAKNKCQSCYNKERYKREEVKQHLKEYRNSESGKKVNEKYENSQKRKNRKREYFKKYRKEHENELKEYQKKYRETESGKKSIRKGINKYRTLKKNAKIKGEVVDLKILYDKFDGICQSCGCKCDWEDKTPFTRKDGVKSFKLGKKYPTHDHIIPLSKGGWEGYDNAQLLCYSCNCSKKNRIEEKE